MASHIVRAMSGIRLIWLPIVLMVVSVQLAD